MMHRTRTAVLTQVKLATRRQAAPGIGRPAGLLRRRLAGKRAWRSAWPASRCRVGRMTRHRTPPAGRLICVMAPRPEPEDRDHQEHVETGSRRAMTAVDTILDRRPWSSEGERGAASIAACPIDAGVARDRSRILFVTPEMADFVKAGGLGDVSAALPRVLARQLDIRILLPGYPQVLARCGALAIVGRLPERAGVPAAMLGRGATADGLAVYVVVCPELYRRPGSPYGDATGTDWPDNDLRFARLGLAAAELACGADPGWRPDLLHLNDWPTALAPAYLAWRGCATPSVLTIHNLAYQGLFPRERADRLGIPPEAFRPDGVEFYHQLSFLKAGLVHASHLTTVSPTYAREITTPALGCGLDGLLRLRAAEGRLSGILNGIDASWDAGTDGELLRPFDPAECGGKRANAEHVREIFDLPGSAGPLFAIVSRLVHQKGLDLAIAAAEAIVAEGGQLVVLGRGEPGLERSLGALAERHPAAVSVRLGFDDRLARRCFAGSDFLLMPSRFEPCGLSQLYAQRLGSLPIAHRTGGLADTIEDEVTGFLFTEFSLPALLAATRRALAAFRSRTRLAAMRRAAMHRPAGWTDPARAYRALYARLQHARA
jgi:starch synthase